MDKIYQKIDGVVPLRHYPRLSRTPEDYARLLYQIAERTFEDKCRALLHITAWVHHNRYRHDIIYYRNKAVESGQQKRLFQ